MKLKAQLAAFLLLVTVGGFSFAAPDEAEDPRARNVILMVADGSGYNTWSASSMYQGTLGEEFYDSAGWVRLAMSTYPLRGGAGVEGSEEPGTTQLPTWVYDPMRAWDPRPAEGGPSQFPFHFAGYRWLRETAPDSASTMTAMITGVKTYNGAINVDGRKRAIEDRVAAQARSAGKRIGIVTDVVFSEATPSVASGVQHADRSAYCDIAVEMLTGERIDLIAGAGNPDYDNNGEPIADPDRKIHDFVGGEKIWAFLNGRGNLEPGDSPCEAADRKEDWAEPIVLDAARIEALRRWKLVQTQDEIESVSKSGPSPGLLVVPTVGLVAFPTGQLAADDRGSSTKVGGALQQTRGSRADPRWTEPGYDPPIESAPSLAALATLALDTLEGGADGFFLMVEGGAIDWAMHSNQMGRMIEETIAFKDAVRAVLAWVDAHRAWDETLVVVTADHDHMLWGPQADEVPFDPLRDNGAGKVPAYRWLSRAHSNALVPLYAKGAGATLFDDLAVRKDPFRGRYLDQTDVYRVLSRVLGTTAP